MALLRNGRKFRKLSFYSWVSCSVLEARIEGSCATIKQLIINRTSI